MLMEVEDVGNDDCYEVTDSEEEKQLRVALNQDNPILSDEEINRMLKS
ncbi:hypothetical protein [Niallia sp. FSL W8-0635]|nr:hypothetical protein [Yersinia enterocolitica]